MSSSVVLRRVTVALLLAFSITAVGACTDAADADHDEPTPDEIDDIDQWAGMADGKADLPGLFTRTVAWLQDAYTNKMSAVWHQQEHPASAAAAIARAQQLAQAGGVADPTHAKFVTTVRRLHAGAIDHSEVNIVMSPGHVLRLVGDPKGAGAFVDTALFQEAIGTPLCLTWTELQAAITTSYQRGYYGLDYVCHTITENVLRSLGVGTSSYSSQVKTYAAARWLWGPILPSGNSQRPADWAVSRSCR